MGKLRGTFRLGVAAQQLHPGPVPADQPACHTGLGGQGGPCAGAGPPGTEVGGCPYHIPNTKGHLSEVLLGSRVSLEATRARPQLSLVTTLTVLPGPGRLRRDDST